MLSRESISYLYKMVDQIPPNDDPEYRYFVVGLRGLCYVGKRLEPYTSDGIRKLHSTIISRFGGHPVNCCRNRCSDQLNNTNM